MALAAAPAEQAEAMEQLYAGMPDSFLDADQAVDVFVDDDGLIRRLQIATPVCIESVRRHGAVVDDHRRLLRLRRRRLDRGTADCTPMSRSDLGAAGPVADDRVT